MPEHGSYFLMTILFPFRMLVTFHPITELFVLLAVVQFPVYGIILGFANMKGKLIPVALVLLAIHALAIGSYYAASYYVLHSPTHHLIEAVEHDDIDTVKNMLDEGADPNTHLPNGCSLLILACEKRHLEMAKLLLEKGADINYQMKPSRDTALFSVSDREQFVELLLSKGADVTIKDREGFTVLDRAREWRKFRLERWAPKEYTAEKRAGDERIISLLERAAKDQKKP
jgi:hypothetical protein